MRSIDKRVASIEAWQEESRKDPFFPLQVEWKPAGKTIGQVMDEMLDQVAPRVAPTSAAELTQALMLAGQQNPPRRFSFFK